MSILRGSKIVKHLYSLLIIFLICTISASINIRSFNAVNYNVENSNQRENSPIISSSKGNPSNSFKIQANNITEYNCKKLGNFDQNYGHPEDIFVENRGERKLAYIAERYGGLVIFDITNPTNPIFLSQMDSFNADIVYVKENIAYVGVFYERLLIVNVSEPEHPEEIGSYGLATHINNIVEKDHLLYFVTFSHLFVLNITNPQEPQELAAYDFGYHSSGLWIQNNYAFVAGTYFHILDISDPENIILLKNISLSESFLSEIYMRENITLLFGGVQSSADISPLIVLNSSDILNPVMIGNYYENEITLIDGIVKGNILYVLTSSSGLFLYNCSNFTALQFMGNYTTYGSYFSTAFFDFDKMYLVDFYHGVEILTYGQTIEELYWVGQIWDGGTTLGVATSNSRAFIANGYNGLMILDVTNPSAPSKLWGANSYDSYYDSITIIENYAFIFNFYTLKLDIFDISNPSSPQLVTVNSTQNYTYFGHESKVVVNNSIAFILVVNYSMCEDSGSNLKITNVTNLEAPEVISEKLLGRYLLDIAVQGNVVFLAGIEELRIYDGSNLQNLISISNFTYAENYIMGMAISGNYAYLADWNYGLRIINIKDLTHPSEVGSFQTAQTEHKGGIKVTIRGNYLYMLDVDQGLLIFDISNALMPILVGQYLVENIEFANIYVEDTIYLAAQYDGLIIIEYTNPIDPRITRISAVIFLAAVLGILTTVIIISFRDFQRRKR